MSNDIYGNMWDGTEQAEVTGFPAGTVQSDVTLDSVEYFNGKSSKNNNYECIRIHYKRSVKGAVMMLTDQILPLNPESIKGWNHEVSYAETLKAEKIRYFSRLRHVLTKLDIDEDVIEQRIANITSFIDLAYKFKSLVDEYNKGQKFYLKVGINTSGYPALSKYPGFLQNMESGDCTLKFNAKELKTIEKYKGVVKAKTATNKDDANDDVEEIDTIEELDL